MDFGEIIYRAYDNSYIIDGNYHVPNSGEWVSLFKEVDDYAKNNKDKVKVIEKDDSLDETKRVKYLKDILSYKVQHTLDELAREYGYDDITSVCSYKDSSVERFASEAAYFIKLRDETWLKLISIFEQVDSGKKKMPSFEELLSELPIPSNK